MNIKKLLFFLSLPFITGGLSSYLSSNSNTIYQQLILPPFSPPANIFPIIWPILFLLMGISSYMISTSSSSKENITNALSLYFLQLAMNFLWPILFFNYHIYIFTFFWLVILWYLILQTIISFYKLSKPAAFLLIPYLLWVTFATYLNLFIALLNPL